MSSYISVLRPAIRVTHLHAQRRIPSFLPRPYQSLIASPRSLHDSGPPTSIGINTVEAPDYLSEGERKIFDKIKEELQPLKLEVQDISGGCGSMYALDIVSDQFKGLPVIKQHRLVNKVLGEEMKQWHGVQMKTKAPAPAEAQGDVVRFV